MFAVVNKRSKKSSWNESSFFLTRFRTEKSNFLLIESFMHHSLHILTPLIGEDNAIISTLKPYMIREASFHDIRFLYW